MPEEVFNIFISWSGEDSKSHEVAMMLREFLPKLHDRWFPFLSSHDLGTGISWVRGLFDNLQKSHFGILCLTQEALRDRPWVFFEAGAIAIKLEPTRQESTRVVPLLIDFEPDQLPSPLSFFQSCQCNKKGLTDLIDSICEVSGFSTEIKNIVLDRLEIYWKKMKEVIEAPHQDTLAKEGKELPRRNTNEYLKEILGLSMHSADVLNKIYQAQIQLQDPGPSEQLNKS